MVDTVWSFIDRTMDMSWIVGENVANALFTQMIHQSIAYAIHTSHAGAVGTVCNVFSGSASLSGSVSSNIAANADLADRASKGLIAAASGLNLPALGFELTRGCNTRIDAVYNRILTQASTLLDEWNSLALSYYRNYNTACRTRLESALTMLEQVTTKAYAFLDKTAGVHLTRLAEQLDTLTGAYAWWEGTLMTDDEIRQIAIRIDLERQASEQNFDDYVNEMTASISGGTGDWDDMVATALADVHECEYRYSMLIQSMFSTLFADVRSFVTAICDEASKTIEDVCAYRNLKPSVQISLADGIGDFEHSPETELYVSPRKAVSDCDQYTVVDACDTPKSLPWELLPDPVIVQDVTKLPVRTLVAQEEPTVVLDYTRLRDIPWSDAGNC